jgi:hypothetical protein
MLANALYFPDIGAIPQRMSGVGVYFDTRIVVEALIGNEYLRRVRRELFQIVYDLGGQPLIFEDTEQEIRWVLQREARHLRRGTARQRGFGVLTQEIIDAGYEASDLELIAARLHKTLGTMKVAVRPRPAPTRSLTVDEKALERQLGGRSSYSEKPEALLHDVNVITAIHRIRKGRKQYRLESCGAVFVTTNYPMVTTSREFFRSEHDLGGVSHVYADGTFETLMWLKKPLSAPDLPRRRIIADSLAALRPGEELWKNYSRQIEELRTDETLGEDDYILLKNSLEARIELMEVTLGDDEAFGAGTVQEVLRRSRASVQGEAAREAEELRERLAESLAGTRRQREAISNRASSWARAIANTLLWLSLAILILLVFLTLPASFTGISDRLQELIAPLIFLAFVVVSAFTILNLGFGSSLRSILQTFEVMLQRRLERFLLWIAHLDYEEKTPSA